MKNEFEEWMVKKENKAKATASQYANAIDKISQHYSQQTNDNIDLYNIDVNNRAHILLIRRLVRDYGKGGRHEQFGQNGHGTVRAAISAYVRFLEDKLVQEGNSGGIIVTSPVNRDVRFTEGDLKKIMAEQVEELFPGYRIFGRQNEKEDLLILENTRNNELLIIGLKAGIADANVLAPVFEHSGSMAKEFPDKNIKSIIIAGKMGDSLKRACLSPDIVIPLNKTDKRMYNMCYGIR
jgi:hypothetical protein